MTTPIAIALVVGVILALAIATTRRLGATDGPGGLVVGVRQSGSALLFPEPSGDPLHTLIGGQTGAGKSVLMRALIAEQAGLRDVALVCLDPKRTALGLWAPRATVVARTIAECTTVLVMLWREVHRRLDVMEAAGLDEWHPSLGGPFIVVHVDELTEVVAPDGAKVSELLASADRLDPTSAAFRENSKALREAMSAAKTGKEAQGVFLTSLARICRSSGVQLVAATQYPESSVLDPQFRSNMSIRVMLRVASDEMVKVILGAGRTDDITADSISYEERGGCWVGGLEGRPVRARGLWVSTGEGRQRAEQTAHLRWPLETVFPGQVDGGEAVATDDQREDGAEAEPATNPHPTNVDLDQVPPAPAPISLLPNLGGRS